MLKHGNGILGQVKSFYKFYFKTIKIVKSKEYDIVYASSSKLFTAFLGAKISNKKNARLYLDIRDIFRETIIEVYKNSIMKIGLNILIKPIERYTFNRANHINLVSEGFKSYFNYKTNYSFLTNGIDPAFLNLISDSNNINTKTILYAGNIGEGQGLDLIIPNLAKALEDYKFIIIGDGGTKHKLVNKIKKEKIDNVLILPPISRDKLLEEYKKASFLFLHLNNYRAFKRVLPSKMFEYAAFDLPIIAGVGGYCSKFIKNNISNVILFDPIDSITAIKKIKNYKYKKIKRTKFIKEFNRKQISIKIVNSILSI